MSLPAVLGRIDQDAAVVEFERILPAPAARVWSAFTDPAELGNWLGRVVSGVPGPGADFVVQMDAEQTATCTVLEWVPEKRLRLSWHYTGEGPTELQIDLVPTRTGTVLSLRHSRLRLDDCIEYGAGWHIHLHNLDVHTQGRNVAVAGMCGRGFTDAFTALLPRYRAAVEAGPRTN